MGKEWLFWGGGKSTKKGKSGGGGAEREAAPPPTGCMCAVFQLFDMHHLQFALHQQPAFKTGSFLQDEPFVRKGLEAPRNSLELEEPFMEAEAASLSSTTMKQHQENFNIPVNIQIKTRSQNKSPRASTSKARTDDLFSECSSSSPAGAKTPTLVARLMGLDQLPESTDSPSMHSTLNSLTNLRMHPQGQSYQRRGNSSVSRQFLQTRSCSNRSFSDNDITGTLSLPETPRISSARRSDEDHRLSLQINKENIGEDFDFSAYAAKKLARRREFKLEDENVKRGGHYARQIVKQVKESVSRKVGLDITNTIKSREQRKDDHVVLLKPNRPSKNLTRHGDELSPGKQSTPSCSPRLLNPKNKPVSKITHSPRLSPLSSSPDCQSLQQGKVLSKPKPQVPIFQEKQNHQKNSMVQKCKKDGTEKYSSRIRKTPQVSDAIRKKKEESFVRSATTNKGNVTDKKCKKTPLSNELLSISVPTLLPVKKDSQFPVTKLGGEKQSQASEAESWKRSTELSSCSSHSYKQEQEQQQQAKRTLTYQENIQDRLYNGTSTSSGDDSDKVVVEYQYYIQKILKRTGIDKSTPVSLAKWYSPSHPLDPSIFHYIELFHPTNTIIPPPAISTVKISKLDLRCNRRLVFQLVDELLVEILKPYFCLKPCWITRPRVQMYGSELIETLCSRIKNFPTVDCQVLEDIDALIDTDLRSKTSWLLACQEGEEEGEGIVSEIEREIVESLVHETAMEVAYGKWAMDTVEVVRHSENKV